MQVSDIVYHAPLGKSDHNVISFNFNCYLDYSKPKERYVYEKADFDAMRNNLVETKWEEEFLTSGNRKTTEDLWMLLKSKLIYLRNQFVPKVKPSGKPCWIDKGSFPIQKSLQEAIHTKKILHRRWMDAKTRGDAEAARLVYGKARNKVTAMMRKAKRKHEKEIALKSQTNPKAFWSHIRRKLKTKTGIAPLLVNNKDKTSTKFKDLEKANILQKQFSSVFTQEPEGEMPLLSNRSEASICHFNVTEEMVHDELLKSEHKQIVWTRRNPPKIVERTCCNNLKTNCFPFQQIIAIWKGTTGLEESKCVTDLQKRCSESSRKLSSSQPNCNTL